MIKKFEQFEYSNPEEELKFILLFFDDLKDAEWVLYNRKSDDPKYYRGIYKIKGIITSNECYVISITYDYLSKYTIEKHIEEIKPSLLSSGYKIVLTRDRHNGDYQSKKIKVHGRDRTTTVLDPIHEMELFIDKNNIWV